MITTTHYVWDGANMVYEYTTSATDGTSYLYGIGLLARKLSGNVVLDYYAFNAHGDVTRLGDPVTYYSAMQYDAFGNMLSYNYDYTNPFRYCGEYYDEETGTYYLRARYYNPRNGRFTQEDPIGQGLNWYTYCANNPVMYIDPSGMVITLVGDETEQAMILEQISLLTNDELAIDENGNVYIVSDEIKGDTVYDSGNKLISRMIDSEYTCTIMIKEKWNNYTEYDEDSINATNGIGSNTFILIDPEYIPKALTRDSNTGKIIYEEADAYIALAHEMIHADRSMRGAAIDYAKTTLYICYLFKPKRSMPWQIYTTHFISGVADEELATVGLQYANTGDITENDIRAEHGLNLRGAYI